MQTITLAGVAIMGGGPAGLMAAEVACAAGLRVDLFDAKGSVGRKVLIAGKGGLNLTHSEPLDAFLQRFGSASGAVAGWMDGFGPDELRDWARGLGVETFVGSSGRVFPVDLKAAPLLRGWVRRLREQGVRFHVHHRWLGLDAEGRHRFETPDGEVRIQASAAVLAFGGGSWPELGSDGAWVPPLAAAGVDIAPLLPANCGFDVGWTPHFAERYAGAPIKPVRLAVDEGAATEWRQGECVATATGVEGSLVYALSARLRDRCLVTGGATLLMDLAPGRDLSRLERDIGKPRQGRSLSEHLRRNAGIEGVQAGLLREVCDRQTLETPGLLAAAIKSLPLRLQRPRPIAEAISSAGGVRLAALDADLMLASHPGLFCAGEMLDWEAPTGGYLLTACFASGRVAGLGAARWSAAQGGVVKS